MSKAVEVADFAGGCFWGIQALFDELPGVVETTAGYEGGQVKKPSWESTHLEDTGHAETVRVKYDPQQISYQQLLEHFFKIHDPTQRGGQGVNIGNNYRSAIFYQNQPQKAAALSYIEKLRQQLKMPVATEVVATKTFWPAEDFHQHYYAKMGIAPHC